MQKIDFLTLSFLSLITAAQAQNCCSKPEDRRQFASNEKFIAAHENPLPFTFVSETGKMISFMAGEKDGNAYAVRSGTKTDKVVFVFHEFWGLNDYIKKEAETLQKELGNVDVYAVDLYDGQVATERDKAGELMNGMKPERATASLQATQDAFITPALVSQFSDDLKKLGKTITIKQYDADHAFANPSNPKYKKEFADEAHKIVLTFLKKGLGLT